MGRRVLVSNDRSAQVQHDAAHYYQPPELLRFARCCNLLEPDSLETYAWPHARTGAAVRRPHRKRRQAWRTVRPGGESLTL